MKMMIAAAVIGLSFCQQGLAQFGGGGFGGGGEGGFFGGPMFAQQFDPNRIVLSDGLVVLSNSRQSVTAFSATTGNINKIAFDKPTKKFQPVGGQSFAIFETDDVVYGYSAKTGTFSSIALEKPAEGKGPVLETAVATGEFVALWTGEEALIYSGESGSWIGIEMKETPQFVMNGKWVQFEVGEKLYICSASSKRWNVIELGVAAEK